MIFLGTEKVWGFRLCKCNDELKRGYTCLENYPQSSLKKLALKLLVKFKFQFTALVGVGFSMIPFILFKAVDPNSSYIQYFYCIKYV